MIVGFLKTQKFNGNIAGPRPTFYANSILLLKTNALFTDSVYTVDIHMDGAAAFKTLTIAGDYLPIQVSIPPSSYPAAKFGTNTPVTFTIDVTSTTVSANGDSIVAWEYYSLYPNETLVSNSTSEDDLIFTVTSLNPIGALGSSAWNDMEFTYNLHVVNMNPDKPQGALQLIVNPPGCITIDPL